MGTDQVFNLNGFASIRYYPQRRTDIRHGTPIKFTGRSQPIADPQLPFIELGIWVEHYLADESTKQAYMDRHLELSANGKIGGR